MDELKSGVNEVERMPIWNEIVFFRSTRGQIYRGAIGAINPLNPTKVTFFTMSLLNSEKCIHDIRSFCCPLFCLISVVRYTSSLLQ